MIDLDGVTVAYEDVVAVGDVDLHVEPGEFLTIVGPSGCGKSTLLRAMGGLEAPTSGSVEVDGHSTARAREEAQIGYVFQQHTLLPWQTALENVVFLRKMADKPPDRESARELLEMVGLGDVTDAYPDQLSGGMKQRVAIARALHLGAEILLMDEPFGELDEITRETLGIEIREIWQEQQKTVVFVTHSVPEAVFLADRCIVMHGEPGRIIGEFDVDLPRPRDETVYTSQAFQEQVSAVRGALYDTDEFRPDTVRT